MDAVKTGNLIAAARKEKAMTQKQLADALHVSDRAVSKWERGVGFPDVALLEPLADALGITVTELLHGDRVEQAGADREVRYALSVIRRNRKEKLRRNFRDIVLLVFSLGILALFVFAFAERFGAFQEDVYLELEAGVYIDGVRTEDTGVVIDGEWDRLRNGEFFGRFAIDWLEKSCRDDVNVSIVWDEEGQKILYGYYGTLGFVDVDRYCYFNSNMMGFAIENKEEGWIIATNDYLAELMALEGYYPLIEPGHHYY